MVFPYLLAAELLEAADLDRIAHFAQETGERFGVIATRLGLITERELAETWADALKLPLAAREHFPAEPILTERISPRFLEHSRVIPLREEGEALVIAMADPEDEDVVAALRISLKRPIERWVAYPADIEAAFARLYGAAAQSGGEAAADVVIDQLDEDAERLRDMASEAPVIRLVSTIISGAVEQRASDIHIEAAEGRLRVRYRVDGVLTDVEPAPPADLRFAIVSRIKVMARLNIAERRLSQDGRMRLSVRGKELDFRVATTPTLHGESVVLRILDRSGMSLKLPDLGFDDELLVPMSDALAEPHGIILVTGPTGSGKTTTLYGALQIISTTDRKVLTIEDPVEYQLEGVNQVQVKPEIGLTFAQALRAFLRQDPDIMMVGEIRDVETAEIAVQAALTGHLILSTLHTNDAASAVTRLLDMGVEDYLMTSTLNGILAQRLVRTLCPDCREAYEPQPEIVARFGLAVVEGKTTLHRSRGCPSCQGSGFRGRTTIAEFLPITDQIKQLIMAHADAGEIQRQAEAAGMRTMFRHGMQKAQSGITTVEEVLRVTRS